MSKSIVHIGHPGGHRRAYLDHLVSLTNFEPYIAPISVWNFRVLLQSKKVLFATVGSNFRRYFIVSLARSIFRRPTCTLFLGAMQLCENSDPPPALFDLILSKIWKILPKQKTLAILPYKIEPSLSKVTNDFIYDPQMWDMWLTNQPAPPPSTALSQSVKKESKGRKILIFIGKFAKRKSFPELVKFAEANQEKLFVISAGKVLEECKMEAEELCSFSMRVEDRFITDDELLSLYRIADYAWCFYSPEYDQASGIYGRAVQLGVMPIVRKGSVIERLSKELGIPCVPLSMKDFKGDSTAQLLHVNFSEQALRSKERQALFPRLRDESLRKIKEALK